ncbi:MAG TPA: hypothetical protein PKD09_23205 [Aggregatilinea sp.]|uniref:hypothetical protein n=1 Tax=Aggregatilinea sp. TaxID=2806333 RepID=UPI002BAC37DF|nr:hypothetical protein [Aggregatilinea sp.]HML24580.1 hypothetical protein [Aggregatilinea sp.]
MIPWTHIEIGQIRINELRHAADQHRMQKALRAAVLHDPAYCRALAWVGHRLVAWGARLERRYSHVQPAAVVTMPPVAQKWDCC